MPFAPTRSTSGSTGTRHFATLDGMRGTAAIAVVTTHAVPFIGGPYLPSGSLAVDLFFLLSGFVLTHAYSKRLDAGLGLLGFMALRFTRLSPLYAIGAVLGTSLAVLQMGSGQWELGPLRTTFAILSLWVMMPSPLPDHFDLLFSINNPRWSLFYEDAVNVVMVLSWTFLRNSVRLAAATVVFGVGLAVAMRYFHTYELGWNSHTFGAGFLRVAFSFFLGNLLYRLHSTAPRKASWLANLIPFALLPLFAFETVHLARYGLLCVAVAFPALVLLGARVQPSSPHVCRFLGDISYPLYVIHVPLLGLAAWLTARNGYPPAALGHPAGFMLLGVLIGLSWILARTYDPRARAWLGSRLLFLTRGRVRTT
jgi:peptidoglycan/LPS O-acetylase OafA/YrhL